MSKAAKPRRPGAPSRPTKELPPLGKLLRKLRTERLPPLTIAQAAERCGLSSSSWHNKEIGLREVSIADLQAIAMGFGVAWKIDGGSIAVS
jgi:transcriptional regulator with XRE-family HTH domain